MLRRRRRLCAETASDQGWYWWAILDLTSDLFRVRAEARPGDAGDCGASSVHRVADVCRCAGWLADSLADSKEVGVRVVVSAARGGQAFCKLPRSASEPIATRLAHDGRFIPLRTTCLDCASSGDDAKSRQVMRSGCHTRGTDSELRCGPLSVIADRLVLGCHSSRWGSTSRGSRQGCSSRARRATSRTAGDRTCWARR